MAGAAAVLPFLPMLPVQILLNNLLYDVSELPIPMDEVDVASLERPRRWDMGFVRNFMLTVGPVSSVFDFLTFFVLLRLLHADEAVFHTGWFVESLATQVLDLRDPQRGQPVPEPTEPVARRDVARRRGAGIPPATHPGRRAARLRAPAPRFLPILAILVGAYLVSVEMVKRWFYRRVADVTSGAWR